MNIIKDCKIIAAINRLEAIEELDSSLSAEVLEDMPLPVCLPVWDEKNDPWGDEFDSLMDNFISVCDERHWARLANRFPRLGNPGHLLV